MMRGQLDQVIDRAGAHGDRDGVVLFEGLFQSGDVLVLGVKVGLEINEWLKARMTRVAEGLEHRSAGRGKSIRVSNHDARSPAKLPAEDAGRLVENVAANFQS